MRSGARTCSPSSLCVSPAPETRWGQEVQRRHHEHIEFCQWRESQDPGKLLSVGVGWGRLCQGRAWYGGCPLGSGQSQISGLGLDTAAGSLAAGDRWSPKGRGLTSAIIHTDSQSSWLLSSVTSDSVLSGPWRRQIVPGPSGLVS